MGVIDNWDIPQANTDLPLQGFEIPLELFLILHENPKLSYTVSDLRKIMEKVYQEKIRRDRIKQVCDQLACRGRIKSHAERHPKTLQNVVSYSAGQVEPILIDSPLFSIAETAYKINQSNE